jgi:L-fuculose-phosphate aldolase
MSYLKKYTNEVQKFLKACHSLAANKYVTGYGGNLAWKLEDDVILITPTMMNKGDIREADLVFINMKGDTIEGTRRPTGEKYMYLKFFEERPDIKSVLHCHAPSVGAFAIMEGPQYLMRPYYPELTHEVGPVPLVPYAEPITPQLAEMFSPFLQKYNTFLMEKHGVVCMSPDSIEWTYMNVELLEMSAYSILRALMTGHKLKELTFQEVKDLDNVVKKRTCPMFGAPGVHNSLTDLYFPRN